MRAATVFDRLAFLEAQVVRLQEIVVRQSSAISMLQLRAVDEPQADTQEVLASAHSRMMRMASKFAVANELTVEEIRGPSKLRHIAWPRQDLMAALIDAGFSTSAIGRFLGRRDHSTIVQGAKASRERRAA